MRMTRLVLMVFFVLALLAGCSNQDAAQLGSLIGRTLGKPLGAVATTIDETFQTAGDVARANPRYQHRPNEPKQLAAVSISPADEAYYYQAEVLVKTQGPARIESLSLQQAEDVSEFWR